MFKKELLFSITRKDFKIEYFRGSGPGGQKVNKTSSACRITHLKSRAVGVSQDERSQAQNTKLAFQRCIESKTFQSWLRIETGARMLGYKNIEEKIDEMLSEENLKIETINEKGEWEILKQD